MHNLMKKYLTKIDRYPNHLDQMSVWGTHLKHRFQLRVIIAGKQSFKKRSFLEGEQGGGANFI